MKQALFAITGLCADHRVDWMATKVTFLICVVITAKWSGHSFGLREATIADDPINCAVILRRCQMQCSAGLTDRFVRWRIHILARTVQCSRENTTSVVLPDRKWFTCVIVFW